MPSKLYFCKPGSDQEKELRYIFNDHNTDTDSNSDDYIQCFTVNVEYKHGYLKPRYTETNGNGSLPPPPHVWVRTPIHVLKLLSWGNDATFKAHYRGNPAFDYLYGFYEDVSCPIKICFNDIPDSQNILSYVMPMQWSAKDGTVTQIRFSTLEQIQSFLIKEMTNYVLSKITPEMYSFLGYKDLNGELMKFYRNMQDDRSQHTPTNVNIEMARCLHALIFPDALVNLVSCSSFLKILRETVG